MLGHSSIVMTLDRTVTYFSRAAMIGLSLQRRRGAAGALRNGSLGLFGKNKS